MAAKEPDLLIIQYPDLFCLTSVERAVKSMKINRIRYGDIKYMSIVTWLKYIQTGNAIFLWEISSRSVAILVPKE